MCASIHGQCFHLAGYARVALFCVYVEGLILVANAKNTQSRRVCIGGILSNCLVQSLVLISFPLGVACSLRSQGVFAQPSLRNSVLLIRKNCTSSVLLDTYLGMLARLCLSEIFRNCSTWNVRAGIQLPETMQRCILFKCCMSYLLSLKFHLILGI